MIPHNRFDDLAVGDLVRARGSSFPGEGKVEEIIGDRVEVSYKSGPRYSDPIKRVRLPRSSVVFACHNQGAPFTSARLSAEEGYADGFQTGWRWPRDRWKHNPSGPGPYFTSSHTDCRHMQAYLDAGRVHCEAWHRGFKDGEKARDLDRTVNIVNLTQPLELDTGEPVELKQIDGRYYFVELLEDQRWLVHRMRKGVTVKVSTRTNSISECAPRYIRNRRMITPITKRSGFILMSLSNNMSIFYPTLEEASRDYHGTAAFDVVILTCEQQAKGEGAEFVTTNVGGPVKPLPQRRVLYTKVARESSNALRPTTAPRTGDNLKLTFEGDKLVGVEVVS